MCDTYHVLCVTYQTLSRECRFDGVVPTAHAEKGRGAVAELGQQVGPQVEAYVTALEARKLKDGIRIAMAISSIGRCTVTKFFS